MLLNFCFVFVLKSTLLLVSISNVQKGKEGGGGGGGGDLVHTPSNGYNNDILIRLMSVDLDLDHLEI